MERNGHWGACSLFLTLVNTFLNEKEAYLLPDGERGEKRDTEESCGQNSVITSFQALSAHQAAPCHPWHSLGRACPPIADCSSLPPLL